MKLLFQKLLANVGESYSPQKVKQLLDQHNESIVDILFYLFFFFFNLCGLCDIYRNQKMEIQKEVKMFRDKIIIKVNNQTIYRTTVAVKHFLGMINSKDKFTVKGIVTIEFENGKYSLYERILIWLLLRKEQKVDEVTVL